MRLGAQKILRTTCLHCERRIEAGSSFCPHCEQPTATATYEERIAWELVNYRKLREVPLERTLPEVVRASRADRRRTAQPHLPAFPQRPSAGPVRPHIVPPPPVTPAPSRIVPPPPPVTPVPPRMTAPPSRDAESALLEEHGRLLREALERLGAIERRLTALSPAPKPLLGARLRDRLSNRI